VDQCEINTCECHFEILMYSCFAGDLDLPFCLWTFRFDDVLTLLSHLFNGSKQNKWTPSTKPPTIWTQNFSKKGNINIEASRTVNPSPGYIMHLKHQYLRAVTLTSIEYGRRHRSMASHFNKNPQSNWSKSDKKRAPVSLQQGTNS
jgi:hypothetical protein